MRMVASKHEHHNLSSNLHEDDTADSLRNVGWLYGLRLTNSLSLKSCNYLVHSYLFYIKPICKASKTTIQFIRPDAKLPSQLFILFRI